MNQWKSCGPKLEKLSSRKDLLLLLLSAGKPTSAASISKWAVSLRSLSPSSSTLILAQNSIFRQLLCSCYQLCLYLRPAFLTPVLDLLAHFFGSGYLQRYWLAVKNYPIWDQQQCLKECAIIYYLVVVKLEGLSYHQSIILAK